MDCLQIPTVDAPWKAWREFISLKHACVFVALLAILDTVLLLHSYISHPFEEVRKVRSDMYEGIRVKVAEKARKRVFGATSWGCRGRRDMRSTLVGCAVGIEHNQFVMELRTESLYVRCEE
jgi:hypothetical protein